MKLNKIKKGDIVGRKSYGKDIIFIVERIIQNKNDKIAILKGLVERIEADSDVDDLEIIEKRKINRSLENLNEKVELRLDRYSKAQNKNDKKNSLFGNDRKNQERTVTGKILHLDGDRKYSQKSYMYYRKFGLNAIVKNIPEHRQPYEVYRLLKIYNPDILIITGHDGMIKRGKEFNNIYNYRNSKYFIQTVKEARRYDKEVNKNLVIFAGACQSYFEALISAGANFASSPARILIDFLDPLIVAEKVAITDEYKYISIDDICRELRDGKNGVDGIGANGKMKKIPL